MGRRGAHDPGIPLLNELGIPVGNLPRCEDSKPKKILAALEIAPTRAAFYKPNIKGLAAYKKLTSGGILVSQVKEFLLHWCYLPLVHPSLTSSWSSTVILRPGEDDQDMKGVNNRVHEGYSQGQPSCSLHSRRSPLYIQSSA